MRRLFFIAPILFLLASCGLERSDLFKVASSDLVVYAYDPVNGISPIQVNAKVTVAFNAVMNVSSVEQAFSLSFNDDTYSSNDGWFEWFAWDSAFSFHFDPDHFDGDNNYPVETDITVRIDTDAKNEEGYQLLEPLEWTFTTGPDPLGDFTEPTVIIWSPSASEEISQQGFVEITFSEPMIAGTVVHGFMLASADWTDVRYIEDGIHLWYDDRTRFRYHPLKPLKAGMDYIAYLANPATGLIVRDRAGNMLVPGDRVKTFPSWWQGSIRIVVDPVQVPEDLADFPVYVDLGQMEPSFFSDVNPAGTDIFVVDGSRTVKLPRELAYLDTGPNEGELWFKAPKLYSDRETVFYLLYDSFLPESNNPDVWSNGYRGVYHLNGGYEDSSVHARTAVGSEPSVVPSIMSYGLEFNGVDDMMDIPFTDTIGIKGTVSLWIRPFDWGPDMTILDATIPPHQFFIDKMGAQLRFRLTDDAPNLYETTKDVGGLPVDWYHLAGTWRYKASLTEPIATPAAQLYFDGNLAGKSGEIKSLRPPFDSLFVGHNRADFETHWMFGGAIDEIHISDVRRSPGWIKAQYNNQSAPWAGGFFKEIVLENPPIPE